MREFEQINQLASSRVAEENIKSASLNGGVGKLIV